MNLRNYLIPVLLSAIFYISSCDREPIAPPEPEIPIEPEPTPPEANWWIIGSIIAFVVAVAVVIWITIVRRRA